MQKPDIPEDEQARLQDLRSLDILDTPPEERFDRLTRIANRLFGVPISLVSLVDDDRQWFKSSTGLSARETPRDISFCGHAILGEDIFVVNDTTTDERFIDNPLVLQDPKIRFYAGCPLTSLNGHKLGTMCLIDKEPRGFALEDRTILKDLAAMVEREIELIQLAINDELTGIPNRRGFKALAEKTLKLCNRKGLPTSIVYFDVDKFKQINDEHGHAEGDRALVLIANNMKSISRDSDIIARLGGDEFAIMFSDTTKETAEFVVKRFAQSMQEFCDQESLGYQISLSHGIVEYKPDFHSSISDLLNEGDKLMYCQKQNRSK
ncbi:MAG: sensor domain-containing diguanylate cyclase [Gammaproteobacteria bacterium]|nr:sensor domain-containing diguanylate cyclase [Gammaproteobacteria bacterium]